MSRFMYHEAHICCDKCTCTVFIDSARQNELRRAIKLAKEEGWDIGEEDICPRCNGKNENYWLFGKEILVGSPADPSTEEKEE